MALSIVKAEEIASSGLARWGIYGSEGAGKSSFLASTCTCNETKKPDECVSTLVVSAGMENIKPYETSATKRHIRLAKVQSWDELMQVFLYLRDKTHPFKAIGFDTWTRMQSLAYLKIVGGELPLEKIEERLRQTPRSPKDWGQWEQIGSLAAYGIQVFCALPLHTIFLFQESISRPKTELDILEVAPDIRPPTLRQTRTDLELIGRLYVTLEGGDPLDDAEGGKRAVKEDLTEVRKLLIGKQEGFVTKGPTHLLGRVVENPTWTSLAKSLG